MYDIGLSGFQYTVNPVNRTIRHEINQLLLTHFGGTYQINTQPPEGPEIVFTYPIASDSE